MLKGRLVTTFATDLAPTVRVHTSSFVQPHFITLPSVSMPPLIFSCLQLICLRVFFLCPSISLFPTDRLRFFFIPPLFFMMWGAFVSNQYAHTKISLSIFGLHSPWRFIFNYFCFRGGKTEGPRSTENSKCKNKF